MGLPFKSNLLIISFCHVTSDCILDTRLSFSAGMALETLAGVISLASADVDQSLVACIFCGFLSFI